MGYCLKVQGLKLWTGDKEIVKDASLAIRENSVVEISGANGSGKSSIARAVAGVSELSVAGTITFDGKDISRMSAEQRAQSGIFLSAQEPVEIPGLTVAEMLRSALEARGERLSYNEFQIRINEACEKLGLSPFFAQRELNYKMSGGEKKKCEVLQILVLRPRLIILDEIDSGLDARAASKVSKILADYKKKYKASLIVISHNGKIFESLEPNIVYNLRDGELAPLVLEGE